MSGRPLTRRLNEVVPVVLEARSKLSWDEEDIKFILVTWSEIRHQIGLKPYIKTKEKAYTYVCELLNKKMVKSYTAKQVADKLKNMVKVFKDKVDNNNRTGSKRMIISEEEEAAFGSSSSARPEFLLNSNGPGQTYRADAEQEADIETFNGENQEHEDEPASQNVSEPAPKKKKLTVAQELHQARIEKQDQFERYMEEKKIYNQQKLEAYNRRTDLLERFLNE